MGNIQVSHNKSNGLSLQALGYICQSVNRVSLRRQESYKQAEAFLRLLGFKYCEVTYVNSYMVEGRFIDLYEYLKGRITLYVIDEIVLGCRVLNAPYQFKKHLKDVLRGYSMIETSNGLLCEREF